MQLLKGHYTNKRSSSFTKKQPKMPPILLSLAQVNCSSFLPNLKQEKPTKANPFDACSDDSPIIEPELLDSIILQRQHSAREVPTNFENLPKMDEIDMEEMLDITIKKLDFCSFICEFDNQMRVHLIEEKTKTLNELINSFDEEFCLIWTHPEINQMLNQMIISNLSRTIYLRKEVYATLGETTSIVDSQWPHLSLVYEILTKYLRTFHGEAFFDNRLIRMIISLLDSPDIKERDAVFMFLTMYVETFQDKICFIYRSIFFLIAHYIEDNIYIFCVKHSLIFLAEHSNVLEFAFTKNFNEAVVTMLSLISGSHLQLYANELLNFFEVLLRRRRNLLRVIILKLIRRFPFTNASHQHIVLAIIHQLIAKINANHFKSLVRPLFSLYAKCATSDVAKIAKISFQIWDVKEILPFLKDCSHIIFPMLYPNIIKTLAGPNNTKLRAPIITLLQTMKSLNSPLFDKLSNMKEIKKPINSTIWGIIYQLSSENYEAEFSQEKLEAELAEISQHPSIVFK